MKNWLRNTFLAVLVTLLPGAYLLRADNGSSGSGKNEVEFTGRIDMLPAGGSMGNWQIGGRAVVVSASTEVRADKGPLAVGSLAEVRGTAQTDGSVAATRVRIEDGPVAQPSTNPAPGTNPTPQPQVEGLKGLVEKMPAGGALGDWTISGRIVRVTADTKLEQNAGTLGVGALVEVKGTTASDGALLATKIEVTAGAGNPPSNPAAPAEVTGVVQFLPADLHNGDWIVSGNTIRVTAATMISTSRGLPAVGSTVEVHGSLASQGVILASTIEVKAASNPVSPMTLTTVLGVVRSRPTQSGEGEWRINDRTVHVDNSTLLDSSDGSLGVGAVVQVNGWQSDDKSIHAESVSSRPEPPQDNPGARLARFSGHVTEDFGQDRGKVDDRLVTVNASTLLGSALQSLTAGTEVEVHGFLLDDGSFAATKVEIRPSQSTAARPSLEDKQVGEVEAADDSGNHGTLRVSGRSVRVTSSTRIQQERGSLGVGASVSVHGWLHPDGFLEATEIEVLSGKK